MRLCYRSGMRSFNHTAATPPRHREFARRRFDVTIGRSPLVAISWTFCVFHAIMVSHACAQPTTPTAAETPRLHHVLLRSDHVIVGRIENAEDQTIIHTDGGSQLTLPRSQIVAVATDPASLYYTRRVRLGRERRHILASFDDQVADADWCLRLGLPDLAMRHVLSAWRMRPESPEIRRLQMQLEQPAKSTTPAADPSDAIELPTSMAASAPPPLIAQVSHQAALGDAIDPNLLHAFTATIQPILIRRCGECHDRDRPHDLAGSSWVLRRPIAGPRPVASVTMENLIATLAQISADRVDESPLWVMACQAHGQSPEDSSTTVLPTTDSVASHSVRGPAPAAPGRPPIAEHETRLRWALREWIAMASSQPMDGMTGDRFSEPTSMDENAWDRPRADENPPNQTGPPRSTIAPPIVDSASPIFPPGQADRTDRLPRRVRRLPTVDDPMSADVFNRETDARRQIDWKF